MKKNVKRSVLFVIFAALLFGASLNTQAASAKWKKACKAYRSYLAKNESHFVEPYSWYVTNNESYKKTKQFMVLDLDKNGVPELISYHLNGRKMADIYVYTYKGGKVKRVKNGAKQSSFSYSGTSAYAVRASYYTGGWCDIYGCKNNHLHVTLSTGAGVNYYIFTMKSGKLKMYAERDWNRLEGYDRYKLNGKKVSAKKYNANLKKCRAKKRLIANTAGNRSRYCK